MRDSGRATHFKGWTLFHPSAERYGKDATASVPYSSQRKSNMVIRFSSDNTNDPEIGFPEPLILPPPTAADAPRRSSVDLAVLYTAGARLCTIVEWDTLLREALEATLHLGRADDASLMLVDEHLGDLYIAAGRSLPDTIIAETRVRFGEGVVGWVAQHRQALLLIGPLPPLQYPKAFPKPGTIASSICAPLLSHATPDAPSQVLGVLNVSRRLGTAPFDQSDFELISAFCSQVAAAIQNVHFHEQVRRHALQLQHMIEISRSLIASLEVDVVLRSIMDKAVELLHCQAGSLLLVDTETQELIFKVAIGPAGKKLIGTRLPPGVGIVGDVAKNGKPLIVNDAKADPRHYGAVDASTALTTRSLLCVPLVSKGRVIGVIEVMNKTDGTPFSETDRDLLTTFATQGAIGLENAELYSDLRRSFTDTVRVITNAVEARDPYTAGHTERVTHIARAMAQELGWTREQLDILEIGALLHDIGKIGVADLILRKPGLLTKDEYTEMQRHPVLGAQMLKGVTVLRPMLPYILYHQERFDGKGYPFGLANTQIPIEGRILSVADTFDAITSDRPYRQALKEEAAIQEIVNNRGTQFDPEIVDALLRVWEKGSLPRTPPPEAQSTSPPPSEPGAGSIPPQG
jgi:putative nucleotidyltransferase with HDIG domain